MTQRVRSIYTRIAKLRYPLKTDLWLAVTFLPSWISSDKKQFANQCTMKYLNYKWLITSMAVQSPVFLGKKTAGLIYGVYVYICIHYLTWRYFTLFCAFLHYVTLCYVTLRYAKIDYVTLRCATLRHVTYIPAYIHTYIHTLHYITLHYITLHYITYIHTYIHTHQYIPMHTNAYHCIPLHIITCHCAPLHTVMSH